MKSKVFEDDKLLGDRLNFVNYLMLHRMVVLGEEKLSLSQASPKIVEGYKEHLQLYEQGYLNYKKWILSKFGESGLETVRAIAFSVALKKGKVAVSPINPPSERHREAIDDDYNDASASLAKWEYEARHFQHIRRVAYATAFVLSASGIIALLDLIE